MRLERFVACFGGLGVDKASARALVAAGHVSVNGAVVVDPGWQVFLGNGIVCDRVQIRGQVAVTISQTQRMFVLHKAAGVLGVINRESRGSGRSLADCIPDEMWSSDLGMFGRLDKETTGLCILGRLDAAGIGSLLLHPTHHVRKRYLAHLSHNTPLRDGGGDGLVPDACERCGQGLVLADGSVCEPATLQVLPPTGSCVCAERLAAFRQNPAEQELAADGSSCPAYTPVRVTIREGKFHQVKRMLSHLGGHGVHRLHREAFGSLELEQMDLPEGCVRPMTDGEYAQVQAMLPPSRKCPERQRSSTWGLDSTGKPLGGVKLTTIAALGPHMCDSAHLDSAASGTRCDQVVHGVSAVEDGMGGDTKC